MNKKSLYLLFVSLLLWSPAMAEIDPEEILRQLPPPEVNYTLPEIRTVKPPVSLPDYSAVEHYGRPRPSKKELDRSLNSVKTFFETQAITSTLKLLGNLTKKSVRSEQSPDHGMANEGQPGSSMAMQQSTVSTQPRPVKPPPITLPTLPAVPPPTGNLLSAYRVLRQNPALLELEESFEHDRQLAVDAFEMTLQMAAKSPKKTAGEGEQEISADEESGDDKKAPAGAHDAVLAKAIGLYKSKNWKGLKDLFAENPEAGDSKDGLNYRVEAEINEEKPNYMQVRRIADQLAKIDKEDAMANFGLALYYFNAKKPDIAKAQGHLSIAMKAKNPPEGSSSLYWSMTFKKFMIPLIILIAALIGGISHVIKKRKASITLDLDQIEERIKPEPKKAGKLMQKLSPLFDKLKAILSRFKKKPVATADAESPAAATEEEATEEAEEDVEIEEEDEENEVEEEDEETLEEETEEAEETEEDEATGS